MSSVYRRNIMGYFGTVQSAIASNKTLLRYSERTQSIAKELAQQYNDALHTDVALQAIDNLIAQIDKTKLNISIEDFSKAIIHSYSIKNIQYPQRFDNYIAMQYLNKIDSIKVDMNTKNSGWLSQKISEIEKHLDRISLVKLQLAKNLKDLQSQNGGHLWIDTDFIEPATETLQASLEQVQDLEDRLYLLNLTYQDHL